MFERGVNALGRTPSSISCYVKWFYHPTVRAALTVVPPSLLLNSREQALYVERGAGRRCTGRVLGAHAQGVLRAACSSPIFQPRGDWTAQSETMLWLDLHQLLVSMWCVGYLHAANTGCSTVFHGKESLALKASCRIQN